MDVERVKQNMGKCGKSPVMIFAAAIEVNGGYMARLEEYVAKAPMMLAKGGEVASLTQKCEEISMGEASLKEMQEILKQLPGLQQGLREGATTALFTSAKKSVQKLWEWMQSSKPKKEMLSDMSVLLSEATMVFPMEPCMQSYMLRCGELLKQAGEQHLLEQLASALDSLCQAGDDVAGMAPSLEKVQKEVRGLGAGTGAWTRELYQKVKDSLMYIMGYFEKSTLSYECVDLWEQAAVTGQEVGAFLHDSKVTDPFVWVEKVVTICRGENEMMSLMKTLAGDGGKALLQSTIALQRHLMSFNVEDPVAKSHPARETLMKWSELAKAEVQEAKLALVTFAEKACAEEHESLLPIAGGAGESKSWLENVSPTASFEEVMATAEKTLFVADRRALSERIDKLKKASLTQ